MSCVCVLCVMFFFFVVRCCCCAVVSINQEKGQKTVFCFEFFAVLNSGNSTPPIKDKNENRETVVFEKNSK